MMDLINIYFTTIIAGLSTATCLSFIGCHLAARHKSTQTMMIGQSAILGVLAGLIILKKANLDSHLENTAIPLLAGLLSSILLYIVSEKITSRAKEKNGSYLVLFCIFWALAHLLGGLFPAVESHTAQLFLGDLVTISQKNSFIFIALSLFSILILFIFSKKIAHDTFSIAIYDFNPAPRAQMVFYFVSVTMICLSVQFMGLLFTLASLFIPTVVLSFSSKINSQQHIYTTMLIALMGALAGFIISLNSEHIPTVPMIAFMYTIFSCIALLFLKAFRK